METVSVIIDKLSSCSVHRMETYKNITDGFGILLNLEPDDLPTVHKQGGALCALYSSDLDQNLADESFSSDALCRVNKRSLLQNCCRCS